MSNYTDHEKNSSLEHEDAVADLMRWHFSKDTGNRFWLEYKEKLAFDPMNVVQTVGDFRKFPDISEYLQSTPIDYFIMPKLEHQGGIHACQSGGTTGVPKNIPIYDDWIKKLVAWRIESYACAAKEYHGNTLAAIPTGPHVVGLINRERARRLEGFCFTVDFDPRWVKQMIRDGDRKQAALYTSHIVDQISDIVNSQKIRYLVTTLPVLQALVSREELVCSLSKTIEHVTLGGTTIDIDSVHFLNKQFFPEATFSACYGSTSGLGEACSNIIGFGDTEILYKPFSPYITYEVIDPATKCPVDDGERGQIVVSHMSKWAFFPNVLERDSAVKRVHDGISYLADIEPASSVKNIVEGVY